MNNSLFGTLKERGYFYQVTNEEQVKKICDMGKSTVYVGIDPTANSLHIGHFFALMMLRYFQDAGHKVIVLIGGATAMVGDPSGKSDLRKMLDKQTVENNINEVKEIIKKFIKTDGENAGVIVNNADWLLGYDYVDFMRDIGIHFNVAQMLACDAYASRIKSGGLTFLEMGYMLMQAYDFVYLNKTFGCVLEIGGSDQWANIIAGIDLGRKLAFQNGDKKSVFEGLTCPLLTNSEGKKMGKTESGTLWVARDKTSVYDFYQYFYNVDDKDTEKLLKLFTRIPLAEIKNLLAGDIRQAKKVMAFEITKLVHGEAEAINAREMATNIFLNNNAESMEIFEIENTNIGLIDLLNNSQITSSKSEARRLIEQGGILLNNEKVLDPQRILTVKDFAKGFAIIKKGKKTFKKIMVEK